MEVLRAKCRGDKTNRAACFGRHGRSDIYSLVSGRRRVWKLVRDVGDMADVLDSKAVVPASHNRLRSDVRVLDSAGEK